MSMQWSASRRESERRFLTRHSDSGSPSSHRPEKSPANGKGRVLEQELRLIKLDTVSLNAEIHYHSGTYLLSQYNLWAMQTELPNSSPSQRSQPSLRQIFGGPELCTHRQFCSPPCHSLRVHSARAMQDCATLLQMLVMINIDGEKNYKNWLLPRIHSDSDSKCLRSFVCLHESVQTPFTIQLEHKHLAFCYQHLPYTDKNNNKTSIHTQE